MQKWFGAAGICINSNGQILMVLQGKPEEKKLWTVPSGGLKKMNRWMNVVKEKFLRKQAMK